VAVPLVVAFGLGLDRGQMRRSSGDLSHLHFDFSERKTRIEFDALTTQLSRLRDDRAAPAAEWARSFPAVWMREAAIAVCHRT
jgi:hypothetical protein